MDKKECKKCKEHINGKCDWCDNFEESDEHLKKYADSKICISCYRQVAFR